MMLNFDHYNENTAFEVELSLEAELHEGYGDRVAFSHTGDMWATVQRGQVHLWQNRQRQHSITLPGFAPGYLGFSQDEKSLFVGPWQIDLQTNRVVNPFVPANSLIKGLDPATYPSPELFEIAGAAWSPDSKEQILFISYRPPLGFEMEDDYAGPESRLLLFKRSTPDAVQVLWEGGGLEQYSTIVINDDYIAAGHLAIRVWRRDSGQQIATLSQHTRGIRNLSFSPDGSWLVSVSSDGMIVVWDVARWVAYGSWQGHSGDARSAAFHPKLPLLATGGWDNKLKLWALGPVPKLLTAIETPDHIEGVAFDPAGRQLVVASRFRNERLLMYKITAKIKK